VVLGVRSRLVRSVGFEQGDLELVGSEKGRALVGQTFSIMMEQAVKNPIRFSLAIMPVSASSTI